MYTCLSLRLSLSLSFLVSTEMHITEKHITTHQDDKQIIALGIIPTHNNGKSRTAKQYFMHAYVRHLDFGKGNVISSFPTVDVDVSSCCLLLNACFSSASHINATSKYCVIHSGVHRVVCSFSLHSDEIAFHPKKRWLKMVNNHFGECWLAGWCECDS